MDRLYRSLESGLLGLGFCLSLAAFAAMTAPRDLGTQIAVTLPMLSVTADAPH